MVSNRPPHWQLRELQPRGNPTPANEESNHRDEKLISCHLTEKRWENNITRTKEQCKEHKPDDEIFCKDK